MRSDKSSQHFTEQYGYYDKNLNALVVEESHKTYGETGFFVGEGSYAYAGTYYLEKNNSRLSWDSVGSSYYMDKY